MEDGEWKPDSDAFAIFYPAILHLRFCADSPREPRAYGQQQQVENAERLQHHPQPGLRVGQASRVPATTASATP